MARKHTTSDRLGGLLANLTEQSAGAFPTTQEVIAHVVPEEQRQFVRVRLDHLRPNPRQPRKSFDEGELRELGASIKEHGLLEPLVIRAADVAGMYDIAAGERRWRAMLLEQMTEADAIEVMNCSDDDLETIALIENVHRSDLTPSELAEAYWRLHRYPDGTIRMSIAEVAAKVKKEKDYVDSHLAIMRAPQKVRQLIIDDPQVPLRTIRDLAQVENSDDLDFLIEEVRSRRFTANDITRMLGQMRKAQRKSTQTTPPTKGDTRSSTIDGSSQTQADVQETETTETTGTLSATRTARKVSPALALAVLETRLRREDAQVRKILSALAQEIPYLDAARKGVVRERVQAWLALTQQLWEQTRDE